MRYNNGPFTIVKGKCGKLLDNGGTLYFENQVVGEGEVAISKKLSTN